MSITTQAAGTSAIYAFSSTDPVLNIEEGASLTGGAGGHAALLDSPVNLITNSGSMSTMDGAAGTAIRSLSGDTTITNSGALMGSIQLHDGAANLLHNLAGGTVQSGASIDLGGTGHFINDGILANAAGVGSVLVNGAFTQSAAGSMRIGIDHDTGRSDSFNILGAAQLEGELAVATLNAGAVQPGSFKLGVVSATGGLAAHGLALTAARSAILSYALSTEGGTLGLVTTANFAPEGLGSAAMEVGKAFGAVQAQGGSVFSRQLTAHLVGLESTHALEGAYRTLGAGGISIVPTMVLASAQRSVRSVTDRLDGWRLDASPASRSRIWLTPTATAGSGAGLTTDLRGLTLGVDVAPGSGPVLLGAAFTYLDGSSQLVTPHATAQAEQFALSLYAIGRVGPAYVSAVAHAGTGTPRFNRRLDALGTGMGGSLDLGSRTAGARIETGYAIDIGGPDAHIVPFAAIEPMLLFQDAGTEILPNARGSAITFHKQTIPALPMSLGIQVDGRWKTAGGGIFSPLLQLAWLHDFRSDRNVHRSFAELPSLVISRTTVPTDVDAASIRFGGQWTAARSWSIQASADAQVSRSYGTIGGTLSLRHVW
ncbi:hypothetical protein GCM10007973_30570 [Polymorphobacter multimanifer]|nr:hypothetical protein GCM10007973_30570 [Polymorphobacter multimanifer]